MLKIENLAMRRKWFSGKFSEIFLNTKYVFFYFVALRNLNNQWREKLLWVKSETFDAKFISVDYTSKI